MIYQPKTGESCNCRPGIERDNCPQCEGTGQRIDFAAIRARKSIQILSGHVSPETAYMVEDYPYGFKLRCKIRYWLEYKAGTGFRLVSQTTNPKRGNVWNKPKASTYCRFGGAMYLDELGHVQWAGLSEYSDGAEAAAFKEKYSVGVPEAGREILNKWVAAKIAYDSNRDKSDPLHVGLPEARRAFLEAK